MYSLAFAQSMFNTVAPELLVVIDEGKGQINIEGVGSFWGCCSFPRLKCNHQVHPSSWPLDFKLVNEILAKDPTQQLLKFIVNPNRAIRATWETGQGIVIMNKNKKKSKNLYTESKNTGPHAKISLRFE